VLVEKKDIPQWKGKPPGRGPFERTACGVYTQADCIAKSKRGVTCQSCKRTHAYRFD
jgi:hypothetical protein